MHNHQDTLDCQICGKVLRVLTTAEAQKVATNPYNYVMFCDVCKKYATEEGYGY